MNKRTEFFLLATAIATMTMMSGCSKSLPVPAASSPASAAAGNVSDMDVTEHVKTALQQNDTLKGFNITVVTLKGDVRLIGVVNNQAQIDEALKIARAADGTHAIHDELTIKK